MKKSIVLILIPVLLMAAGCAILGPGSVETTIAPTASAPAVSVPATSIPAASIPLTSSGTSSTEATVPVSIPTTEATVPVSIPSTGTTAPTETTAPAETEPTVHSHSFSDWSQTEAPGCETTGMARRQCACGETETKILAAQGHHWDKGTVTAAPASCTDQGLKLYRCDSCGGTYEEQITGDHNFGQWAYEEYTYVYTYVNIHGSPAEDTKVSHRQVRSCTDCGHRETDGTPEHYCVYACTNHVRTTIQEGNCITPIIIRSTCKICGWYTDREFESREHVWGESEFIHVSDYGPYTNELDLERTVCTLCDYQIYRYTRGQGFDDVDFTNRQYKFQLDNRYTWYMTDIQGTAYSGGVAELYQFEADEEEEKTEANHILLHPDRQTVYRNPVYDSNGMLLQFDVSWYDTYLDKRCTETVVVADIPNHYSDEMNDFYENEYGDHPGRNPRYIILFYEGHLRYTTVVVSYSG